MSGPDCQIPSVDLEWLIPDVRVGIPAQYKRVSSDAGKAAGQAAQATTQYFDIISTQFRPRIQIIDETLFYDNSSVICMIVSEVNSLRGHDDTGAQTKDQVRIHSL